MSVRHLCDLHRQTVKRLGPQAALHAGGRKPNHLLLRVPAPPSEGTTFRKHDKVVIH